ncbi:MAG: serine/threonine protein kinase [Elusimicrobia bacterium]|nr:serine/threonine protein kinase [Elusimicrobiota bacterium]
MTSLLLTLFFSLPARAGTESRDTKSAFELAGPAVKLIDESSLSREELAELGKRYAQRGLTQGEIDEAPRETQRRMDAVDAKGVKLAELSRGIDAALEAGDDGAFRRLLGEREALRTSLTKDHDALVELQKTLRAIWKRAEYEAMAGILTRKPSGKDFLEMERAKDFHGKVTKYYEQARAALARDEQFHAERLAARERRRRARLRLAVGAAAAALLVPAGIFLWRSRRAAALPFTATVPVNMADGALLGGIYRVDREVGRGAMGVVYEAMDMALNRKVALKRMRDELRQNPRELQLLLTEAQAVAALKHPNIVAIFNVLQDRGEVYLVFEFVEGTTLGEAVAARSLLSPVQTVGVAAQVAAAVDYAHSQRVIHRDLKPANVMVSPDGRAKVMDFGIAHQAQATVARLTRAQNWGTPAYMAPEQELGQVSKAADIYSFAACCYEMLTGRLPFPGPNFLAQKQRLVFAPPSSLVPTLPKAVDEVLARGLAPAPQSRFVTASALVSALQGALGT